MRTARTLADVLKPLKVKSLVITRADKYAVRGIVLTECPIERRESGKDFEVELSGDDDGSVASVKVDGKKLMLQRSTAKGSRPRKSERTQPR